MHSEWGGSTRRRRRGSRRRGGAAGGSSRWGRRRVAPPRSAAGRTEIGAVRGGHRHLHHAGLPLRAVGGLVTNFHLPRSTLFMLVSALMGLETMRAAYAHAIREGYRFYSYGDASLLLPE